MHVSSSDQFGAGNSRFFLPLELPSLSGPNLHQSVASSARFFLSLGMPRSSDSNLQQSDEEGTTSENARNALMDVKEEEAILAVARTLNGEDVPTSKKKGRPSKEGKASAPPKKKKCSTKKTIKKAAKEIVDLDGGSSSKLRGQNIDSNSGRDGGRIFKMHQKTRSIVVFLFLFFEGSVFCFMCIVYIKNFKKEL
jgi:hypothetical protein